MSFPNLNPFIETFLDPTRIFLFGKPFPALVYNPARWDRFKGRPRGGPAQRCARRRGRLHGNRRRPRHPTGTSRRRTAARRCSPAPGRVEQALRQAERTASSRASTASPSRGTTTRCRARSSSWFAAVAVRAYRRTSPPPPAGRGRSTRASPASRARTGNSQTTSASGRWTSTTSRICLDLEIGNYEQVLLELTLDAQEEMGARSAGAARSAGDQPEPGHGAAQRRQLPQRRTWAASGPLAPPRTVGGVDLTGIRPRAAVDALLQLRQCSTKRREGRSMRDMGAACGRGRARRAGRRPGICDHG